MLYKTCRACGKELPVDNFWKKAAQKDGLQPYCKICATEKTKLRQREKPDNYRNVSKRSWWKNREKRVQGDKLRAMNRKTLLNQLKQPCAKCGEDRLYLIEFHHIDPSTKLFTIGEGGKNHVSEDKLIEECNKCVCLCSNCHREFHHIYGRTTNCNGDNLLKYLGEEDVDELV